MKIISLVALFTTLLLFQTECSIRNNPGEIFSFDFGGVRRKQKVESHTYKKVSELEFVPRVAFVTGKRLQTVDFG